MGETSGPDLSTRLRRFWHPVALVSELTDEPVGVELLGEQLVVARLGEEVLVAPNRCPHKSARLDLGRVLDGQLECGYHGLRFDSDGTCVSNPARPGRTPPRSLALAALPAQVSYGMVWACLEPSSGERVPEFHAWVDDPGRVEVLPSMRWHCAPSRAVEGICDLTHFPFVHPGTLVPGGAAPPPTISETEDGLVVTFPEVAGEGRRFWSRTYRLTLPFTIEMTIWGFDDGSRWTLFNVASPLSLAETRVFATMMFDGPLARRKTEIGELELTVYDQDRRVIESIDPARALDVDDEVMFAADRHLLRYRQRLLAI